jgi:hypothetical protein
VFTVGSVERLPRDVVVGGEVHFRVEISQPHVDPKGRQATPKRTVAAAGVERHSRQINA